MLTNADDAYELDEVSRFCSRQVDAIAAGLTEHGAPLHLVRRLLATSGAVQWVLEAKAAELSGLTAASDAHGRSAGERLADRYVLEHDRLCEPVRIEGEDSGMLAAALFPRPAE